MKVTPVSLHVSENIGDVIGEIIEGEKTDVVLTLAHSAGAGMHHSFMIALAEALAHHHIATLRFNFPFMERKKKTRCSGCGSSLHRVGYSNGSIYISGQTTLC